MAQHETWERINRQRQKRPNDLYGPHVMLDLNLYHVDKENVHDTQVAATEDDKFRTSLKKVETPCGNGMPTSTRLFSRIR